MILAAIDDRKNLEAYRKAGADAVIVSIPYFSMRSHGEVPLLQIPDWSAACREQNLQLYINMDRFCMEEDLEEAGKTLAFLDAYADGIYYGDEGLLWIADRLQMKEKMVYAPQTLVTSSLDAAFYMEQGIQSVCLANELSLPEIQAIAGKVKGLELLVQGYSSILYSRRPLLSNYLSLTGQTKKEAEYTLIEQNRTDRIPLLENEAGTILFSPQMKTSLPYIKDLVLAGIERFRIDNIFAGDEKTIAWIKAYADALQGKEPVQLEGSAAWFEKTSVKRKDG